MLSPSSNNISRGCVVYCVLFLAAPVYAQMELPARSPFTIAVTLEGLLACETATKKKAIKTWNEAQRFCEARGLDGSEKIKRLLNDLEPNGPQGKVQVGYTMTIQVLALYVKRGNQWVIDEKKIDAFTRVIRKIRRPVVVHLAADHFDTQGAITDELISNRVNLMQLPDGKPPIADYFGYRIVPYTLLTDRSIPVNKYRFEALRLTAKKLSQLPDFAKDRIVAVTLGGELHQMFPDFENGMGRYQDIRVTDYSPASVRQFRLWLAAQFETVKKFNTATGFSYTSFAEIDAPRKDIRKEPLRFYGEHYDAFADGILPFSGWLWDPRATVERLDLLIDGQWVSQIDRGFNRLDVYRTVDTVTSPNVGFRHDFDYSQLKPGQHVAQISATAANGQKYALAELPFSVMDRAQKSLPQKESRPTVPLRSLKEVADVRYWLDLPRPAQDLYFNPLARLWNQYRSLQVNQFLTDIYVEVNEAGLPKNKLYSHQIVPQANSTWNPQLFAVEATLNKSNPWLPGINLYGGSTHGEWMKNRIKTLAFQDYGVPEFNPQQWKSKDVHLEALKSHYLAGARFVSPYYFSVIPEKFKQTQEHGVNRMELRAGNRNDGSDMFLKAIQKFAKN